MASPGDENLLAYLSGMLAQLEAVSGEDPEGHASLDKLREALGGGAGAPKPQAGNGQTVVLDEAQLEGLLDNLDKQMTALEATLSNLDPESAALLAQGLSAWGEAGPAAGTAQQPGLPALDEEGAEDAPGVDQAQQDTAEDVVTHGVDQAAEQLQVLTVQDPADAPTPGT